jgi:aminoacyl-tRNA hydrolase
VAQAVVGLGHPMAQAVVGLGNPGGEYRDSRHNVGQQVVDLLAGSLHGRFTRRGQALVARTEWRGETLYLIKPLTYMNVSGPVVAQLGRRLGFGAAECILVYDDIDLPLGRVRIRMKGSDGGHRGVRSVIDAFRTDELRRVKVGIGRPPDKAEVPEHVLSGFSPDEIPLIQAACAEAADRVLQLSAPRPP